MRLRDKVCLVTGGAQGIGRATARRFAEEGAIVAIFDKNGPLGDDVARALSTADRPCAFFEVDVTSEASVNAACASVLERFGRIDVLVNNAGIYPRLTWDEVDLAEWRRVLDTDLTSMFLMCKAVQPAMKRNQSGSIINVSSTATHMGSKMFPHYIAAKAGVQGLTRAMAHSFGDDGIRVNAVSPGLLLTETVAADRPVAELDLRAATQAIKRRGYPEDLGGVMTFLASDDSAFVSGQNIIVDGGRLML